MVANATVSNARWIAGRRSVVPAGTGFRVFVREGERVTERLVVPGRARGDLIEVSGKLTEGEEVAIDGTAELSDGASIQL